MEETEEIITDQLTDQPTESTSGGLKFCVDSTELMEHLIKMHQVREISLSYEPKVVEYVDYSDFILKNKLKALIYEMRALARKQVKVFSQFEQNLHSCFSILYGMCSSQSSFIFSAFTGTSFARIPSL